MALTTKLGQGKVFVVEDFNFKQQPTAEYRKLIDSVVTQEWGKVMFVAEEFDPNVLKALLGILIRLYINIIIQI